MKTTKRITNPADNTQEKIRSLQEMIATAERTISSAKQMLTQIHRDTGVPVNRQAAAPPSEGHVIHGNFDGQIMIGEDGKQYPVPANYASKSKLVEGDMLKLTITSDGNFVYKQIGPVDRRYLIGIVEQDERGNYAIIADGKKYKVLLAAATYFKIEAGDEVTLVVPRQDECVWGAIENVLRKSYDIPAGGGMANWNVDDDYSFEEEEAPTKPAAIEKLEKEIEEERKMRLAGDSIDDSIMDEWTPDIEALKKEAGHPVGMDDDDK